MKSNQLPTALNNALSLHRQGFLDQALEHYIAIFKEDRLNAECIHLIGVVALQKNRAYEAVELIQTAITLRPHESAYHCNLGNALQMLGDGDEALKCFSTAIDLNPTDIESWVRKGDILSSQKKWDAALQCYDHALQHQPSQAHIHCNKGVTLEKLQRFEEALHAYEQAIDIAPDFYEAHNNKGNVLLTLGREIEAIRAFDQAITLQPLRAQAYSNRGNAFIQLKKWQEAKNSISKALSLQPDFAEAHSNLGIVLQETDQHQEALTSYAKALALNPQFAQAYVNRSVAELALGENNQAIDSCNRALQINPHLADAFCNRGTAEKNLNLHQRAIESYQSAKGLAPRLASAHCNMGVTLKEMQRLSEALDCFDNALEIDPYYVDAHWNKALTQLLAGDFASGWISHEWRWKLHRFSSPLRNFVQPLWLGENSLTGKTLLVHSEQGLGDTIQFFRYVLALKQMGINLIVEVHEPLVSLFQEQSEKVQIVTKGADLPHFDVHCPMMSLPLALQKWDRTIPYSNAYLHSNKAKNEFWLSRVPSRGVKIGLVWQGSAQHNNDKNRSIPLDLLVRHLPEQFNYICLQPELSSYEKSLLAQHDNITFFHNEIQDFSDTAALCQLMNAVVCVDTSVAHLNGALGLPTKVLLPYAPDWRWMLKRKDSPWYESVTLYRQGDDWDWEPTIKNVFDDLVKEYNES
jgi:tetratricopeptide (TPR) repeat protein